MGKERRKWSRRRQLYTDPAVVTVTAATNCARPCSSHLTYTNSFQPSKKLVRWMLIFPLFSDRLRHRQIKELAAGHTAHFTAVAPAGLFASHVVIPDIVLFFFFFNN